MPRTGKKSKYVMSAPKPPKRGTRRLDESQANYQAGKSLIKVEPNKLLDFFPTKDLGVLSKIQLTEESLYSSTTLAHADYIRDIIKLYYAEDEYKDLVITDATSCIGGTLMSCIEPFGEINAVELNPIHAKIMKHNLETVFPDKHVNVVNDNFISVLTTFKPKSNVVIIDPPWGGCDYYKEVNLKLYLNDKDGNPVEMSDIINMLKDETDMVLARVPFNYDMDRLKTIKFEHTNSFHFLKKYPQDGTYRSGKVKSLYHIYVFSHMKPVGDPSSLDPHKYYAMVNYRDIDFVKL